MAAATAPVATEKKTGPVVPLGTVSVAGGIATAGLDEMNVTTAPSGGAGPSMERYAPVIGLPPVMGVVEMFMLDRTADFTFTVMALDTPP